MNAIRYVVNFVSALASLAGIDFTVTTDRLRATRQSSLVS